MPVRARCLHNRTRACREGDAHACASASSGSRTRSRHAHKFLRNPDERGSAAVPVLVLTFLLVLVCAAQAFVHLSSGSFQEHSTDCRLDVVRSSSNEFRCFVQVMSKVHVSDLITAAVVITTALLAINVVIASERSEPDARCDAAKSPTSRADSLNAGLPGRVGHIVDVQWRCAREPFHSTLGRDGQPVNRQLLVTRAQASKKPPLVYVDGEVGMMLPLARVMVQYVPSRGPGRMFRVALKNSQRALCLLDYTRCFAQAPSVTRKRRAVYQCACIHKYTALPQRHTIASLIVSQRLHPLTHDSDSFPFHHWSRKSGVSSTWCSPVQCGLIVSRSDFQS